MSTIKKKIISKSLLDTFYSSEIRDVYIDKEKYNIVKSVNLIEWDLLLSTINHALMVNANIGKDTIEIASYLDREYNNCVIIYYGVEERSPDRIYLYETDSIDDILCYLVDKGYSIRDTGNDFYIIFYNLTSIQKMKYYAESVYDYIMGVRRKEKIEENTEFKLPEVLSNSRFKDTIVEHAIREKFNLEEDNYVFSYIMTYLESLFLKDGYTFVWDKKTYFARYYKEK